jgi:hypothetical protein
MAPRESNRSPARRERAWALFVHFANNPEPAIVPVADEAKCRALATYYLITWGAIPRASRLGYFAILEDGEEVKVGVGGVDTTKVAKIKAVFDPGEIVGVMVAEGRDYDVDVPAPAPDAD